MRAQARADIACSFEAALNRVRPGLRADAGALLAQFRDHRVQIFRDRLSHGFGRRCAVAVERDGEGAQPPADREQQRTRLLDEPQLSQ